MLAVPPGQILTVLRSVLADYPDTAMLVIDTLGRVMPDPYQGETTYQRDYRIGASIKRIADEHPDLAIVVIHHTRKAFADDFIDSVSGTYGLVGAADTVITVSRRRGQGSGTLRVTGRDVPEASYAVTFRDGAWRRSLKTHASRAVAPAAGCVLLSSQLPRWPGPRLPGKAPDPVRTGCAVTIASRTGRCPRSTRI